jgi:membrane fusion protein, heavy metal efflux system
MTPLHRPAQPDPAARHLSGVCLTLLLLALPIRVLAHGGHGDEFQGGQAAQSAGAIQVDATTASRMGLKVQPVTQQRLSFGIQATGQIESLPSKQVEVTNPVGDTVRAGQPVALLSSPNLAELRVGSLEKRAEAEANVQQAQADLQLALANYNQQQQLATADVEQASVALRIAQERYDKDKQLALAGAIPRRQMLESENQLAAARAALAKTNSRLQVLEAAAQLKRARSQVAVALSRVNLSSATYAARLRQLGATPNPDGTITIVAPISGIVADREVTLGQSAQDAGSKLMTIVDGQVVLATANIYEKDLNQVAKGQQVRVTVDGLPNRTFSGRITVIGSLVEGDTRIVPVKAELVNTGGVLKPGMFATLELLTNQTAAAVVVIPKSALVEANGKQQVYIQNGQSFEPVDVMLGRSDGDLIEVKSGLFAGDNVVVQGAPMLYAQSLRGGSEPKAVNPDAPPNPEVGKDAKLPAAGGTGMPWWMLLPIGGAIAAGTFFAGTTWANRRHRKQLAFVTHGDKDYSPDRYENSHNGLPAFASESQKSDPAQPSSVPESHQHPSQNN